MANNPRREDNRESIIFFRDQSKGAAMADEFALLKNVFGVEREDETIASPETVAPAPAMDPQKEAVRGPSPLERSLSYAHYADRMVQLAARAYGIPSHLIRSREFPKLEVVMREDGWELVVANGDCRVSLARGRSVSYSMRPIKEPSIHENFLPRSETVCELDQAVFSGRALIELGMRVDQFGDVGSR
jgi:hypothetical protein